MLAKNGIVTVLLVALSVVAPCAATAANPVVLEPTGVEADARGKAKLALYGSSRARFDVTVRRLGADADYDLVVNGIRVHTLRTNRGGRATARFATEPRGRRFLMLGFDPRGAAVEVRDATGQNVLVTTFPGEGSPDIACCIPDDSGNRCQDRNADECAALGGEVSSAASCLPDPCAPAPPVDPEVVCCLDPDQCSISTQPQCLAAGGSVIEAGSCDANPCAPVGPPPSCVDDCWSGFFACLGGCTSTYCAPFCQVDLGRCVESCPPAP